MVMASKRRSRPITRNQIISNAWAYDTVTWVCEAENADPDPRCPDWRCDFIVGKTYNGLPYLWGGDRKLQRFRADLDSGLCAGAHLENDCIEPDAQGYDLGNACWATGIDCSGFVCRLLGNAKIRH